MRFIESILLKDGRYHNLDLHQQRVEQTFQQHMPNQEPFNLRELLPPVSQSGTFKARLLYDSDEEDQAVEVQLAEYSPRKIESLEVSFSPPFAYSKKYEDRSIINNLLHQANADDIIIVIADRVTDGSYFNLAFFDGKEWVTPETYLLNGIRRQALLAAQKIKEVPISVQDIPSFKKVSLINAMLDLGELEVPIHAIWIPKNVG